MHLRLWTSLKALRTLVEAMDGKVRIPNKRTKVTSREGEPLSNIERLTCYVSSHVFMWLEGNHIPGIACICTYRHNTQLSLVHRTAASAPHLCEWSLLGNGAGT